MNDDLRNSAADQSQRMLNAIEPGTVMPIHRHMGSSETVICIRRHFVENFYDEHGILTDAVDMVPGGLMVNVPAGQWHNLESLESGTVLFEAKDGPYPHPRSEAYITGLAAYRGGQFQLDYAEAFEVILRKY